MNSINRDQLLKLFRADAHKALVAALDRPTISGLAVYENADGRRRAVPTSGKTPPNEIDEEFTLLAVYRKPELESSMSSTMAALEYLAKHPDSTPYGVAKMFGITPGAIYHARKRRAGRVTCPCCSQVIREGFILNQER